MDAVTEPPPRTPRLFNPPPGPRRPAGEARQRPATQNPMSSLDYKEDARDLHAFKELRFFLSHSVPLEIRCSVSRLELPLVADYLLGSNVLDNRGSSGADHDGDRQKHNRGEDAEGVSGGMETLVRRIVSEPELVATCQLFSDGQPMHKVAMRCEQREEVCIPDVYLSAFMYAFLICT